MYTGVKNHHKVPPVSSYDEARKALAVWNSKPHRGNQVAQVLGDEGGDIAFRLYDTDVVTWCPDGSVLVDNYGSLTTSEFARRFLPGGVWLNYPTTIRGRTGGASTIQFLASRDPGQQYTYHAEHSICQGSVVRFTEQGNVWLPDLDTCYDITLPDGVDRKAARGVTKRYNLAEFETWLTMAAPLLGDVEHEYWDIDQCMEALQQRDWRRAAGHMPVIQDTGAFGQRERAKPLSVWCGRGEYVSLSCLNKLKLAIWDEHDLLTTKTARVWPYTEFHRKMQRLRELVALDLSGLTGMGPR